MLKDYFRAICKISRAFGTVRDNDELLNLVVESAIKTMDAKGASLYLKDEKLDKILPVAYKGLSEYYINNGPTRPSILTPILLKEGYIYCRDAVNSTILENPEVKRTEGIASILIVPVMIKNVLLGILAIFTEKIKEFSKDDIRFLQALADEAGMAIQDAKWHTRIRQTAELFLNLASNINSSLDMKKILHILTQEISESFDMKGVVIRLLNKEHDSLDLVASYGLSEKFLNKGPISPKKSLAKVMDGETVIIKNATNDDQIQYPDKMMEEGIKSILSVPIKSKNQIIGAMRLYSEFEQDFPDEMILVVEALAHHGGLAIENAFMYLQLQEENKILEKDNYTCRSWF